MALTIIVNLVAEICSLEVHKHELEWKNLQPAALIVNRYINNSILVMPET